MAKVSENKKSKNSSKFVLESKYRLSNVMYTLITALFLILFDFWAISSYNFSYMYSLFIVLISLLMFVILLSVLSRTSYKRKVMVRDSKDRDEVIKALVKEVEGIEKQQKQKNVNDLVKPNFVGSTDSMIYHKLGCRYAKNIKAQFKLENNSESFFRSKKFNACNVCLKKK